MPSVSQKQHDFMKRVAQSPEFAEEVGVPQSVGQEYLDADAEQGLYQDEENLERDPPSLQW